MAITNYNAYLKQLENIYNLYGYSVSEKTLRDFITREHLDVNYGITIQEVREDLTTIHNKSLSRKAIIPPFRPVPNSTKKTVDPFNQAILKTYEEYMAALEKLYINKGKVVLNDTEIQNFISINKIDAVFGVTKADVKKDLQTIDRKWHPPVIKPQPNKAYAAPKPKAKLTTYKQYMDALESLYVQNGKSLSDTQLAKFITDNAIDVGFGVRLSEVKKDLQDIEKKLNSQAVSLITSFENYERELSAFIVQNGDKSFLDLYIKKFILAHGMGDSNPNLMSDIRMDLVFAQSKMPPKSLTAQGFMKQASKDMTPTHEREVDNKFRSDVVRIILKHKDEFSGKKSFKGLLWDYFPDRKREINVLMILANYGMLEDMRLEKTINFVFVSKYVTRIINEYGIEKNFAMEMALVWCYGYGEGVLGKKMTLQQGVI